MAKSDNEQEVSVAKIAGAAKDGAKKAVNEKIIYPIASILAPGDMRTEHAPHPVDAAAKKLGQIKDLITQPSKGDMSVANAPHPVDNAITDAKESFDKVKAAGPVKGTEIGVSIVVGAMIDSVDPAKKVKIVDEIVDAASDTSKVGKKISGADHVHEGELIQKEVSGKDLTTHHSGTDLMHGNLPDVVKQELGDIIESNKLSPIEKARQAAMHPLNTVTTAGSPKNMLAQAAYDSKPGMGKHMDAYYHQSPGHAKALLDDHSLITARAHQWNTAIDANPQLAEALKGLDQKSAKALLNDPRFDKGLGIEVGPKQIDAGLTTQQLELKEKIDGLTISQNSDAQLQAAKARQTKRPDLGKLQGVVDVVTQAATPGAFNTQGVVDRMVIDAAGSDTGVFKNMAKNVGSKYVAGKTLVAAGIGTAIYYATHGGSATETNREFAQDFMNAIKKDNKNGNTKALEDLVDDQPVLGAAALSYLKTRSAFNRDGMTDSERKNLDMVVQAVTKQIREKGPESFNQLTAQQDVSR